MCVWAWIKIRFRCFRWTFPGPSFGSIQLAVFVQRIYSADSLCMGRVFFFALVNVQVNERTDEWANGLFIGRNNTLCCVAMVFTLAHQYNLLSISKYWKLHYMISLSLFLSFAASLCVNYKTLKSIFLPLYVFRSIIWLWNKKKSRSTIQWRNYEMKMHELNQIKPNQNQTK